MRLFNLNNSPIALPRTRQLARQGFQFTFLWVKLELPCRYSRWRRNIVPFVGVFALVVVSCNGGKNTAPSTEKAAIDVRVTTVKTRDIKEYRDFNGVTQYQKKESLRANITGYISYLPFERGDQVRRGATFATLRTKEQSALAEAVKIDSSLAQFARPLRITTNAAGIITKLNVVKGDYVAEGDILAVIAQPKTLVVKVNVPFSERNDMEVGTPCQVMVPNQSAIDTEITARLPVIDSVNQTQAYLIALPDQQLPEKLNVNVRTVLKRDSTALSVPHEALQTNELMTEFWVMKVFNDTLAIKEKVTPLLQNDSVVQINSVNVKIGDRVVTEGSYQMQDSTKVKIMKR